MYTGASDCKTEFKKTKQENDISSLTSQLYDVSLASNIYQVFQ